MVPMSEPLDLDAMRERYDDEIKNAVASAMAGLQEAMLKARDEEMDRLRAEVERFHAQEEAEKPWNDAIDWLLNSNHCGDPDIQTAFWGITDGRCTREDADRGHLADGTPLSELPQHEGEGR